MDIHSKPVLVQYPTTHRERIEPSLMTNDDRRVGHIFGQATHDA